MPAVFQITCELVVGGLPEKTPLENCFNDDWKDGDWKDCGWQSACINCQVDFGDQKLTEHPFIICMANLPTFV